MRSVFSCSCSTSRDTFLQGGRYVGDHTQGKRKIRCSCRCIRLGWADSMPGDPDAKYSGHWGTVTALCHCLLERAEVTLQHIQLQGWGPLVGLGTSTHVRTQCEQDRFTEQTSP
jgi:hypothetical protein